jgi:hypothetical protein
VCLGAVVKQCYPASLPPDLFFLKSFEERQKEFDALIFSWPSEQLGTRKIAVSL